MKETYVLELHIVVRSGHIADLERIEELLTETVVAEQTLETTYEIGGGIRKEEDHGEDAG